MVIRIKFVCIILFVLTLLDSGIIVSLADVEGTWKINGFGADSMALTRVGNQVYGTYNTPQGQGTIGGLINAQDVWRGTWSEPFNDDWGYFSAAFSNDTYLRGSWKYAEGDYDIHDLYTPFYGPWDGYFQGEKQLKANTTINA